MEDITNPQFSSAEVVEQPDVNIANQPPEIKEYSLDSDIKALTDMGYSSTQIASILVGSEEYQFDEVFNWYKVDNEEKVKQFKKEKEEADQKFRQMELLERRERKKKFLSDYGAAGNSVLQSVFGGDATTNVVAYPDGLWAKGVSISSNDYYNKVLETPGLQQFYVGEPGTEDIDYQIALLKKELYDQAQADQPSEIELELRKNETPAERDYRERIEIASGVTDRERLINLNTSAMPDDPSIRDPKGLLSASAADPNWERFKQGEAISFYGNRQLDGLALLDEDVIGSANKVRFGEAIHRAALAEWNDQDLPPGAVSLQTLFEQAKKAGVLEEFPELAAMGIPNFKDAKEKNKLDAVLEFSNKMIDSGTKAYATSIDQANEIYAKMGSDIRLDAGKRSHFDALVEAANRRGSVRSDYYQDYNNWLQEHYRLNDTPLSPYIRGEKDLEDLPEDWEVSLGTVLYNNVKMDKAVAGLVLSLGDWWNGEDSAIQKERHRNFERNVQRRDQLIAEQEMIYRMLNDLDDNKAFEVGLWDRTWDSSLSWEDWWEATWRRSLVTMAQGVKSIGELAIPYVGPAVLFGDVYGQNYADIVTYHPEMNHGEAVMVSILKAGAELTINQVTRRMGVGAEAGIDKMFGMATKNTMLRSVGGKVLEKNLGQKILKGTVAEGLEEGLTEMTNHYIDVIDDLAYGRKAEDMNWVQVADSFFAGMGGAVGVVGITNTVSHMGHSKYLQNKSKLAKNMGRIKTQMANERDPKKRADLANALLKVQGEYQVITAKEQQLYDGYNDQETQDVVELNQEIFWLKHTIQSGEYVNRKKVTKEQRKGLEERLKKAIEAKAKVESRAEQRINLENDVREESTPVNEKDATGNKKKAKRRRVKKSEAESNQRVQESGEVAPEGQTEQADALSQYDENTDPKRGGSFISGVLKNLGAKRRRKRQAEEDAEFDRQYNEGMELLDSAPIAEQTDSKGRTVKFYSKTTTKDGVTTTKYEFNRSDQAEDQRSSVTAPVSEALSDQYTIDPSSMMDAKFDPESNTWTEEDGTTSKVVGIKERRVGPDGASATVTVEQRDANGDVVGRVDMEVKLNPAKAQAQQAAEPEASQTTEETVEETADTPQETSTTVEINGEKYTVTQKEGEAPVVTKESTGRKAKEGSKNYNKAVEEARKDSETTTEETKTQETQEKVDDYIDLEVGEDFDIFEAEKQGMPLDMAIRVQLLMDGVGRAAGLKVRYHKDMKSFYNINSETRRVQKEHEEYNKNNPGKVRSMYGYQVGNTVHLNPLSEGIDINEEFAHGALRTIIGRNAKARERLYNEILDLGAKLPRVQGLIENQRKNYRGRPLATLQEEVIASYLSEFAEDSKGLKQGGLIAFAARIIDAINSIFRSQGSKQNVIKDTDSLLKVAKRFKEATQGKPISIEGSINEDGNLVTQTVEQKEAQKEVVREAVGEPVMTEVETEDIADVGRKRQGESESEYRARLEEAANKLVGDTEGTTVSREDALEQQTESVDDGRMSVRERQSFDYLKDTEIFYTHYPTLGPGDVPVTSSRYTTYSSQKSITVNDYFHFRNWYNKQTGNQRSARIAQMYFIKDGKRYTVKPPKPKVDKEGNPVYMELPMTYAQRQQAKRRLVHQQIGETAKLVQELNNQNRRLFEELPWSSLVNAQQFRPATKPSEEQTMGDRYVASLIEQKNLEAAIEMGVTKEQVQKRLDDSGRSSIVGLDRVQDGDLVNATGMSPFEESVDGAPVGMFSVRTRKILDREGIEPMEAKLSGLLAGTEEGSVDDLVDAFTIVMGYDRTSDVRKGMTSGLRAILNLDPSILSTHVDERTAQKVLDRFVRRAIEIAKKTSTNTRTLKNGDVVTDPMGGTTEGEFAVAFSVLNEEATIGNPDVFDNYMDALYKMVENGTMTAEEFIRQFPAKSLPALYNALLKTDTKLVGANGLLLRDPNSKRIRKLKVPTLSEVRQITNALKKFSREGNLPDPFSTRKSFYSSASVTKWMDSVNAPQEAKFETRLSRYYNDKSLSEVESATLIGYKKFKYRLVEVKDLDGNVSYTIEGLSVEKLEGKGFKGALKIDGQENNLKVMRDVYKLEDVDPDFRLKRSLKDDATIPGRDQALLANQYSLFEFNASENDINTTEGKGGMASIRTVRSFKKAKTEQGTFELSDLSAFQMWRNKWVRRLADKYNDVFLIQDDIERTRGKVSEDMDFRMKEELMYGKAAEALRKTEDRVDALMSAMREDGVTVAEVNEYLYAKHTKERNDLIKERTNGEVEDGSGQSTQDAEAYLNSIPPHRRHIFEALANMVEEIQQDTRNTMREFQLVEDQTMDEWEEMFDSYVPLAGVAQDEMSSSTTRYPVGAAGLHVFGPIVRSAKGRKSKAEGILAQIVAQNASVHIKARTNEALLSLYELVAANPNPSFWRIVDGRNMKQADPHSVGVLVEGRQMFIQFADASYAETLRGMTVPKVNAFVRMMRFPTTWLRRVFTTLAPEFMVSNFSRDIQTAVFNAAAESEIQGGIVEGKKIVGKMLRTIPTSLKVLLKEEGGPVSRRIFKENPKIKKYYDEYRENGGKTGWAYVKDLSQIANELEEGTKKKNPLQRLLATPAGAAKLIEGTNDAFENAIRLSAYIAAREQGITKEKAAQLAKNITVNFNKSGEYGQTINSIYLFFNASVQGTTRLGRSLLGKKDPIAPDGTKRSWIGRRNGAQKLAMSYTILGGLLTMINIAGSDDDEAGNSYYMNSIPDYIKERNIIIMKPNGKDYWKIPLPYGFNSFWNLGVTIAETSSGKRDATSAIGFMGSTIINSFSPVSFDQSEDLITKGAKTITPTIFKPFVDVLANETYFGGPVYAEQSPYGHQKPESEMSFRSPESVQQFFRWMNRVTGGSERVSGSMDYNPDKLWYILEYYVGSTGKFVTKSVDAVRKIDAKMENPEIDIEASELPFLRIIYGEPSKWPNRELYAERTEKVYNLKKEMEDPRIRRNDPDRYKGIVRLDKIRKFQEKKMKALRAEKREARKIEDYTARTLALQKIEDKERLIIMQFIKHYEELRGKD